MLFTNPRATIKNNHNITAKQQLLFTNKQKFIPTLRVHVPTNVSVAHSQTYEEKVATIQNGKKIKWGEPFWNLFHVLAEKVKDSDFPYIRTGFLNMIYTICSNLPCPDCTQHAIQYLNGINFNTIQTKGQLREMLYHFHNAVNIRKGYPIYPIDQLESKYKTKQLVPVIEEFIRHFLAKPTSFRLIADDLQRKRVSTSIKEWFKNHIYAFDL
jgi:hypothetical protein